MWRRMLDAGALMMVCMPLAAATFAVDPVRVTLDMSQQPVAVVTVRNDGTAATVIQAQSMRWSIRDAQDVYEPSSELVVTPPVFRVDAGGTQVLRVGMRRRVAVSEEQSFRLYLTEVPAPPEPGFRGLNVALRLGVPVFVTAPGTVANVRWQASIGTDGQVRLSAFNAGTAHQRVQAVELRPEQGSARVRIPVARDLLAGQQHSWTASGLPELSAGSALQLLVQTDTGSEQLGLSLGRD